MFYDDYYMLINAQEGLEEKDTESEVFTQTHLTVGHNVVADGYIFLTWMERKMNLS